MPDASSPSAAPILVGRQTEASRIFACLKAKRNVLLEGPVGVGKTHLALEVCRKLGSQVFRIDGDSRYSEQKLSGWFDPPTVIKRGFSPEAFMPGPLVEAMQKGGVLFINEFNRLPEGVQNILLPAIDERVISVPRYGTIQAKEGFLVIATQNPKEFVATSHLSEAILDRFELVVLDYQDEAEEAAIVEDRLRAAFPKADRRLGPAAVRLARLTREHPRVKRGASVRAALSVAEIAAVLLEEGALSLRQAFIEAALLALPTRIELEHAAESDRTARQEIEELVREWSEEALNGIGSDAPEKQKKKVAPDVPPPLSSAFQSIFSSPKEKEHPTNIDSLTLPPEAFSSAVSLDEGDLPDDLASASAWDIATRYHEFKAKPSLQKLARQLRRISAQAILTRAQEVMGAVTHPMEARLSTWAELPAQSEQVDLDLDETLENSPLAVASASGEIAGDFPLTGHDVWMGYNVHRQQPVVLSVDTSLSMTGEKLALTAVALAVVLLQFPEDPVGIIAFENEARVLKFPEERISLSELVERFLDVPAQGYTHLEEGMKAALKLVRSASRGARPPSTVLLTDGKYTAGRDPAYLAPRFPHLVVLKMGRERASAELCRELAQKGKGVLKEVGDLETLPNSMYSLVKDLLRGRSVG